MLLFVSIILIAAIGYYAWRTRVREEELLDYTDALESELDVALEKLYRQGGESKEWVLSNFPELEGRYEPRS